MTEDKQSEALGKLKETGKLTHKDVKDMKAGDEYETPHPEGITSICYSCTEYETCNVKTGTCTKCDRYKNRAEAYKTDEQRYSEEQDAIDRETKKKLREMEQEEKMQNLPSDISGKKKFIRMSVAEFERVVNGEQQYIIAKNDSFATGQEITIGEFAEGKATGRTLEMFISHMDDEKTSSALEDGYCVLSVHEAYRFCDQCEYFDRVNASMDGMSTCSYDTLNHWSEEQACHRFKRRRLHIDGE